MQFKLLMPSTYSLKTYKNKHYKQLKIRILQKQIILLQ